MHGKLKTWKKRIKTDFHGQGVPYNMYCHATAVLKVEVINYHPQVYVEECKCNGAENQQRSMLSDPDDEGFFLR